MALAPLFQEYGARSGTTRLRLLNMVFEPTPHGPRGFSLRGRPGLVEYGAWGSDEVWEVVSDAAGNLYALIGSTIYRNGVSLGSVAGGGTRQASKSERHIVFVSGGSAYYIDYLASPEVVTQVTDPDLPEVSGVVFANGRFVYPNTGSSQFHYSAVSDPSSIDGLGFANAEGSPDPITRAVLLGSNLMLLGAESIDYHQPTADQNNPYDRVPELSQTKGCISPYSVLGVDNGVFFLGREKGGRSVYRSDGGIPQIVSTPSIAEVLTRAAQADIEAAYAVAIVSEEHTFYVVSIPNNGSYAYDIATKKWSEWASYGKTCFRLRSGPDGIYGDDEGGLFTLSPQAFDDDGDVLERVAPYFLPTDRSQRVSFLNLECATGVGLATGQGSEPLVEQRFTDEVTGDWTDWEAGDLGVQGDRAARVSWTQQGMMHSPGRAGEVRCTDPVEFVCWGLSVNQRP